MATSIVTDNAKSIRYCRLNHDYDAYLNDQYIGSFPTYLAAETELDYLASDLARQTVIDTADMEADRAAESSDEAPLLVDPMHDEPLGWCYVCGDAAWEHNTHGPLCPSHAAVWDDWKSEQEADRAAETSTDSPLLVERLSETDARAILESIRAADYDHLDTTGTRAYLAQFGYEVRRSSVGGLWTPANDWQAVQADPPVDDPDPLPPWTECAACGGAHHIQRCPEMRAALGLKDRAPRCTCTAPATMFVEETRAIRFLCTECCMAEIRTIRDHYSRVGSLADHTRVAA